MFKTNSLFFRIISSLIVFNLVFVQNLYAEITGLNSTERKFETVNKIVNSDVPSDLPVAGISDYFDYENMNLVSNYDLSSYIGKKIFIGYGVYDLKENNCKYIEVPGITKMDVNMNFAYHYNFAQHTYGIVSKKTDYYTCQSIAGKFGGYPVVIDNAAENMFLLSNFIQKKVNSNPVESIWVGLSQNPATKIYYNTLNREQRFFNWDPLETGNFVENGKSSVIEGNNGYWHKENPNQQHYCVVEFNSPDIYRTIKVCAPWWQIRRDYQRPEQSLYNESELERINQADIPLKLTICTKYKEGTYEEEQKAQDRIVYCTSYYSIKAAPECTRDLHQPQCKVSECAGYIENNCALLGSDITGKGYVKGNVVKDGVLQEAIVKDDVRTNKYKCPPSTISVKKCVEKSTVLVYPKECPGSQCESLKECIFNAVGDQKKIDTCYNTYVCTKIYPSADIPPTLNPDETIKFLHGICPDGTMLNFEPDILDKASKKCVKYEEINETKHVIEKCSLNRPYVDKTVDMSFTEKDPYQDDPNCVRMDKVNDSVAPKDIVFSINNKNYFKNKITKVFLDGNTSVIYNGGNDNYLISFAMPDLYGDLTDLSTVQESIIQTESQESLNLDCSAYDPSTKNNWYQKNKNIFLDGNSIVTIYNLYEDLKTNSSYGILQIPDSYIDSKQECENFPITHNFNSYVNHIDYSYNQANGSDTCLIYLNKIEPDSDFETIKIVNSKTIQYTFKNSMNKKECMKKAICLDGIYNEKDYSSSSTVTKCIVTVNGSGTPSSYYEELEGKKHKDNLVPDSDKVDSNGFLTEDSVKPKEFKETGISTSIDALENIIVIEEYLRGGFDFFSNFIGWYPLVDKFYITTQEYSNAELKLPEMSTIGDLVEYHGIYKHTSYKEKKPNLPAAVIGGSAAAGAAYAYEMLPAAITGIGIAVFVVILIFTAKPKNMDRQKTEYHYFKDVPKMFYVPSIYENRLINTDPRSVISGEQSSHNPKHTELYWRFTYCHEKTDTGRLEPGDFKKVLKALYLHKYNYLITVGFDSTAINATTHPDELTINYGYPGCPWWNPWCTTSKDHYAEIISNLVPEIFTELPDVKYPEIPRVWTKSVLKNIYPVAKTVGTYFLGADNSLMILVPYVGSYELTALDKYGNTLSQVTITDSMFQGVTSDSGLKYAQVNFGWNMNLAAGLTPGDFTNACTKDRAVEWGGGVSGVFFESQRTDYSKKCQKSNDAYVKDHSMTTIRVRPVNMDRYFEYNLTYPLPFANRVWIYSLEDKEIRHYRCYQNFGECDDNNFKAEGE